METLRTIAICFGGIFTFAFGFAWIMPLAIAGTNESKPDKKDLTLALLDFLLILLDCIPLFWLFRAIPEAPSSYKAVRETWKKESSVRLMFWLFIASLATTVGSCFLPA